MAEILIVEDSPTQAKAIRMLLEDEGYEVRHAADGQLALAAIESKQPTVVCTDLDMPNMNGMQLVEAVRKKYPTLPVVLMTAHGSEEIAALALRKGAASYVPKAYLSKDLLPILERLVAVAQTAHSYDRAMGTLQRAEYEFLLDNDPHAIQPVITMQDDLLARMKFGDATDRIRVSVALQEALLNAIYHGNLELDSSLRQEDEQIYHDKAKSRSGQAPFNTRRVHFVMKLSANQAVYEIRDEGPGFDLALLPDPTDPTNLGKVGGRGLLLIRAFIDRVEHNPKGNSITLTKRFYRDKSEEAEALAAL